MSHLELNPHTVNGQFAIVWHCVGGGDQRPLAHRQRLAQAGIDVTAFARRQHGTKLIDGAAAHSRPGDNVFRDRMLHETGRCVDVRFAGGNVFVTGDTLHAAPVVNVVVGVEHGNHRLFRAVLVVQLQTCFGS